MSNESKQTKPDCPLVGTEGEQIQHRRDRGKNLKRIIR